MRASCWLSVLLLLTTLAPLRAAAQPVLFNEDPTDAAVAQVRRLLEEQLAEAAEVLGTEQQVGAALVDVDDDGQAEILGQGYGVFYCGTMGCQTFLYRFDGQRWRRILQVNTDTVRLADTRTNGLRDLILNGDRRWVYDGETYGFSNVLGDGQ